MAELRRLLHNIGVANVQKQNLPGPRRLQEGHRAQADHCDAGELANVYNAEKSGSRARDDE